MKLFKQHKWVDGTERVVGYQVLCNNEKEAAEATERAEKSNKLKKKNNLFELENGKIVLEVELLKKHYI